MKCTHCSREVTPVVAVDIDGTIARYHDHFLHFLDLYFNRPMPRNWDGSGDWEDFLHITRPRYEDSKLAFRQGGFKRWMPEYAGGAEMIEDIRAAGAEIWITTTRPYLRLDSVDPDTREWLERNGIYYDHLLYHEDKYRQLCHLVGAGRVVAVIEDLPSQYRRAVDIFGSGAAILVNRVHNTAYRNSPILGSAEPKFASTLKEARDMAVREVRHWKAITNA